MTQIQTNGTKRTTDHDEIERWAEERQGTPAIVESTWDGNTAVLRIDFGEPNETLMEIGWDQFFQIFDEADLEFHYQGYTADGDISRFHRFVEQE
ncbi:MAG: hypothetical protein AAB582_00335 [Patescibacteria group bacterium]